MTKCSVSIEKLVSLPPSRPWLDLVQYLAPLFRASLSGRSYLGIPWYRVALLFRDYISGLTDLADLPLDLLLSHKSSIAFLMNIEPARLIYRADRKRLRHTREESCNSDAMFHVLMKREVSKGKITRLLSITLRK